MRSWVLRDKKLSFDNSMRGAVMVMPFLRALGVVALSTTSALACSFHNYAPEETLVDRLLGSEVAVLARSAPDNPFRYIAVENVRGTSTSLDLPLLVDTNTRRKLALNTSAKVLLVRDAETGEWQRLAFVDYSLEPILREVMQRLPAWEIGPDTDRFHFFASLLNHPDENIHNIALSELDQVSYAELQTLPLEIDAARLEARLNHADERNLRPIRLLLLGMSGQRAFEESFSAGLDLSARAENSELGAYATALIELAGPEAVKEISEVYLTDRNMSLLAREVLIEAFALHSVSGAQDTRNAISKNLTTAVWLDHRLAGAVARQFGSRGDVSQQEIVVNALQDGGFFAPGDRQDMLQYLAIDASLR